MADTSDIKNGLAIRFNHDIYTVVEFQHVKPGKGAAFVRTKLKSLTSGKVIDNTFPSGTKIEIVNLTRTKYQYSYPDGNDLVFIHPETFEQITIPRDKIDGVEFLKENEMVDVVIDSDTDKILTVDIPIFVVMKVVYTEPGVKGDTATNALKPATLETGAEVKVPLFIDNEEVIKVDTRTRTYVERVK